jgi:predicted helicase
MDDFWRKEQKLQWLAENPLKDIAFERIVPDKSNNWINLTDNDWNSLLPLIDRKNFKAVFNLNNPGISTNRDYWVYDFSKEFLIDKMQYFINEYLSLLKRNNNTYPDTLKWSHVLKRKFQKQEKLAYSDAHLTTVSYRPFNNQWYYADLALSDLLTNLHFEMLGENLGRTNQIINFTGPNSGKPFMTLGTNHCPDLHFVGAGAATQCMPLYRFDKEGNKVDNITDWSLEQFRKNYKIHSKQLKLKNSKIDTTSSIITKEDIFHYTYAVLHYPAYREKYELNLKRDFPRIPFYKDFFKWADWGKALMDLHINYEAVKPYNLKEITVNNVESPKAKLKAGKEAGAIALDENTSLTGIPKEAWDYKLGNRSALEWILDQYKESKPKDPTIAEKFNTYHFADYKAQVIDLLKKVCTVSIETMKIINEMSE